MTMYNTPDEINMYRLVTLKSAIGLYIKTGMKVNSAFTPTNMLNTAGHLLGKTYKRGQLQQAWNDLNDFINDQVSE